MAITIECAKFYKRCCQISLLLRRFLSIGSELLTKSDWLTCEEKTHRGYTFLILIVIQAHIAWIHTNQQLTHTCNLSSKWLKEDDSLEKCEVAEHKNVIHPSCCKKWSTTTLVKDEWEGPLFCGMHLFIYGSFIYSQHTPVPGVVICIIGHIKYDSMHVSEHTSL